MTEGEEARRAFVLMGLRGVGKTTVGKALAGRLGLSFVDSDERVLLASGITSAAWIRERGEDAFRAFEASIVLEVLDGPATAVPDGLVLALGGGGLSLPSVRERLGAARRAGTVLGIWLRAPCELLVARCASDARGGLVRPTLLAADPTEDCRRLAALRGPVYARFADLVVDAARAAEDVALGVAESLAKEGHLSRATGDGLPR